MRRSALKDLSEVAGKISNNNTRWAEVKVRSAALLEQLIDRVHWMSSGKVGIFCPCRPQFPWTAPSKNWLLLPPEKPPHGSWASAQTLRIGADRSSVIVLSQLPGIFVEVFTTSFLLSFDRFAEAFPSSPRAVFTALADASGVRFESGATASLSLVGGGFLSECSLKTAAVFSDTSSGSSQYR